MVESLPEGIILNFSRIGNSTTSKSPIDFVNLFQSAIVCFFDNTDKPIPAYDRLFNRFIAAQIQPHF
jgi:hypothetical protein